MRSKRAAIATIVLALIGLAISVEIARVHSQMSASDTYIPSCNFNQTVNCEVVLSSEYAHFAGVPLPWWALLTYLSILAAGVIVWRAERASLRRQLATALFAVSCGSAVFSAYLAFIALVVLRAVCVMCTGLYLVNAGMLVATWFLLGATRVEAPGGKRQEAQWQRRNQWIAVAATAAVVVFLLLAWREIVNAEKSVRVDDRFRQMYDKLPVENVNVPGGQSKGTAGKVTIVEFSDFECPHCAHANRSLKRVLPRFDHDVQLVFHHFPLDSSCNAAAPAAAHRYACLAAVAAECAAEQGRFWPYEDLLFENQSSLNRESLIRYAEDVGIDRARFLTCLDSDAPRSNVVRDTQSGKQLGLASTPTFFINGRRLAGALEPEQLEYVIRRELGTVK